MAPCPFSGTNVFSADAQNTAVSWTVGDPTHEANWVKAPHVARAGLVPLERYADYKGKKP